MRPAARGHGACWGLRHSPVPAGDGPWSGKTGVLSRYGMLVFFLKKIQKENCKFLLAYFPRCAYTRLRHGGSSSVGRAPGCGPGGRGFKSHLSPHKKIPPLSSGVFLFLPPAYGLTGHQRPRTETRAGRRTGPALGLCARKGMCRVRRGAPAAVMGAVACVKDVPRPQGSAPDGPFPALTERDGSLLPVPSGPCLWMGPCPRPATARRAGKARCPFPAGVGLFPQGSQGPLRPLDGPPLPKQGLLRTKHSVTERGAAW